MQLIFLVLIQKMNKKCVKNNKICKIMQINPKSRLFGLTKLDTISIM